MRAWGSRAVLVLVCLAGACSSSSRAGDTDAAVATTTSTASPTTTTEAPATDVVAGSIDEAGLDEPYIGDLTFVAPRNCSVPVTETQLENGSSLRLEYTIVFGYEDPNVAMATSDMRLIEADGEPVSPSDQVFYGRDFHIPMFVVDEVGTLVEIRGVDTLISELAITNPALEGMSEDQAFVDLITNIFYDEYWRSWYGTWIELGTIEAPVQGGEWTMDGANTVPVEVTSVGTTAEDLAAIRLAFTLEGDSVGANLDQLFAEWFPGDASQEERDRIIAGAEGRVERVLETVVDPDTLQPHSVWSQRHVDLSMDGESLKIDEQRLVQFDWAASDCA